MTIGVVGDLYSTRPDLYDLMHADYTDDVSFLEDLTASLGDDQLALELGCGTGRLLMPLLAAGARVVGLDRNSTMLDGARQRVAAYGDRARLVEGDMRHFNLGDHFDLALIGLNTFMHLLTTHEQLDCLESIWRHLRPGGWLVLDLANPHAVTRETLTSVLQHRFSKPAETDAGMLVTLWSSTVLSPATQLTHTTLFFDEMDTATGIVRRSISEVLLRLIYRFELELLLARTGFAVKYLYGDYESAPYDDDSERLICVGSALA